MFNRDAENDMCHLGYPAGDMVVLTVILGRGGRGNGISYRRALTNAAFYGAR